MLASVFDSGAVYYPTILVLPVATGAALANWRPQRRGLWILLTVVAAFVLLDFALDGTRFDDLPFFVVLGFFMSGLGLLARFAVARLLPARRAPA
jgi:hypothetical protein